MQEENIAIRLKFLISKLGINSSVFADNCGISRATLSQLLTGRNKKISDVLISQIHKAYPDLSILWLLFNEGDMWMNGKSESEENESNENTNSNVSQTSYQKKTTENLNSPNDGRSTCIFPKENELNSSENIYQNTPSQQINSYLNSAGLISEIKNLRSKIKKVVQITIYYDDSTFEAFYPK